MNKANTAALLRGYPRLFGNPEKPGEVRMRWGFECGDGWFRLLHDLSSAIEEEAFRQGLDPDSASWPKASQVKEKFGTLRFYMGVQRGEMGNLIDQAAERSEHTCETCGLEGELRTEGWYHVACDSCEEKHRNGGRL